MLRIHHLNDSRSHRILWLLEELEVPYELVSYKRGRDMRAPESLKAVHPLGKVPAIEHEGRTLVESGPIVEYLIEHLGGGRLRPTEGSALLRYRFYLHFAEGSMMPPLLVKLLTTQVRNASVPFFLKPVVKKIANTIDNTFTNGEIEASFGFVDDALKDREWLTGEFSGADIMMSFPLEAGASRVDLSRFARIQDYIKRFQSREAYLRALEKGGSYVYGPNVEQGE